MQLALKEMPEVLGRPIELVVVDNKSDKVEAANAVKRLVERDKVVALIGTYGSSLAMAGAEVAEKAKVPGVGTSCTSPLVTQGKKYYFRACFIDPYQGEKMATYASEKLGAKTAAVFYQTGNDYSEGLMNAFVEKAKALGIEIVDSEAFAEGDKDFKAQMTNIAKSAPDVVFSPNYYEDDGKIVTQARQLGYEGTFLGGDGWDGLEGYASNDQLKDTYFCANYAKGSNSEFEDAYKAEYGEEYPNGFSPLGYDAAKTVVYGLQAAEDAGLEAGTDDYKQAVIDAIASGTIDGITGTFTFDEHHDPVKQTAILTYVDGKPVLKEMF